VELYVSFQPYFIDAFEDHVADFNAALSDSPGSNACMVPSRLHSDSASQVMSFMPINPFSMLTISAVSPRIRLDAKTPKSSLNRIQVDKMQLVCCFQTRKPLWQSRKLILSTW
jgi:hypothetical protein